MELLELIKTRRSVRKWKDKDVPNDLIEVLVDASRWAPSSCNRQTCRFLVLRRDEHRKVIGNAIRGGRGYADKAPIHVLVLIDLRPYHLPGDRNLPFLDAAAAIENFLLMAHYLGLGACWINWSVSQRNWRKIRTMLCIPYYVKPVSLIVLGYSDVSPKPPVRKSVEDFIRKF